MHDGDELLNIHPDADGLPDISLVADQTDALGIPHELRLEAHFEGDTGPVVSLSVSDLDRNLLPELTTLKIDLDGDGHPSVTLHGIDLDGDLIPDWVQPEIAAKELWKETQPFVNEIAASAGRLVDDALNWLGHEFTDFSIPEFANHTEIHGTPLEDMQLWEHQQSAFSCAVATSDMLFRSIGLDVGEPVLAEVFQEAGIYDPAQGTSISLLDDVLNRILETVGSDHYAEEIHGFELADMKMLLDQGVRPLIALDSAQLADPLTATLNDLGLIPDCGHAVQLTGIIETGGQVVAVINDPGSPNGMGMEVPWDKFMNASSHFDFEAVAVV